MENRKKSRVLLCLSGIVSILAGVLVWMNPITGLLSIALVVGVLITALGIFRVIDGFGMSKINPMRSMSIFDGVMWLIVGIFFLFGNAFFNVSILSMILMFGFILTAIMRIQYSFIIQKTWVKVLTILLNIAVIGCSFYMIFNPALANAFLVYTMAIQFIMSGIDSIIVAFSE